jgi:hypothetical protein
MDHGWNGSWFEWIMVGMDYGLNSLTLVQNMTFHALDLNVIVIFVLVFYLG